MSALGERIGYAIAQRLMTRYRAEERQHEAGLRDDGQPSEALTSIKRALWRSGFTADERHRIRTLLDIDPLKDIGGLPGGGITGHERGNNRPEGK